MNMALKNLLRDKKRMMFSLCGGLLCMLIIAGCDWAGKKKSTTAVNIHGVNYTDLEFSYYVEDPDDKNNHGGGEIVNAFSAGGILCCYELPPEWRPGIKVSIVVTRPKRVPPGGRYEEEHEEHVVEVPQYAEARPGALWVIRNSDETMSLVSSEYQPNHEKWPGKVKGWPVPSLEWQRARHDLYIREAEQGVELYEGLLADLKANADKAAVERWEFKKEIVRKDYLGPNTKPNSYSSKLGKENHDLLQRFSGPTDPGFRAWLKNDGEEGLKREKEKLEKLKKERP